MRAFSRLATSSASTLSSPRERPRGALQSRADASAVVQRMRGLHALAARGVPGPFEAVRAAVAGLSGQRLDDVAIHRNSSRPAAMSALAFASHDAVELGPGQDHAIGHELWHVAQQRAGRVQADARLADGTAINRDARLEHEADTMGARAVALAGASAGTTTIASTLAASPASPQPRVRSAGAAPVLQGLWTRDEARAEVAVDWSHRSGAYKHILGEFQRWHGGVNTRSGAVKREFLQRLLDLIDRYVAAKAAKRQDARRRGVLAGMARLRANVATELAGLGAVVAAGERVYVAGGRAALDEDRTLSGGITHGQFRGMTRSDPGAGGLDQLGEGVTIHVYGHANYGTAIGSHHHNHNPSQLVDALLADGLAPETPVILRLFSCGSGAENAASGVYRTSTSFVQRVAERMARRGFEHATVIGYGLYMIPARFGDAPLGKGRKVFASNEAVHEAGANKVPVSDREVVWLVREGAAFQSSGERWVASNPSKDRYEINLAP